MHSPHEITDRDLVRYAVELDPPGYVKEASGEQLTGGAGLHPDLYADKVDSFYPTHTAAATWASHAKFAEAGDSLPPARRRFVADRLGYAAGYFRIEADVAALAGKRAALAAAAEEAAPSPDDCAWVGPDGVGRLPIRTADEVKAAAAYLVRYRDRLGYDDRRQVAARTLAKAAAIGADAGEHEEALERMAGLGGAPMAAVKAAATRRAALIRARHPEEAAELDALAASVGPGWGRETLRKLAGALDDIDRSYGLRAGDRPVDYPEDQLFCVSLSLAKAAADGIRLATGAVYAKEAVAGLDLGAVREVLGDKAAEDLADDAGLFVSAEKAAAALPAAGGRGAALVEALLSDQGIEPIGRLPARQSRLDRAGTLRLAAQAAS